MRKIDIEDTLIFETLKHRAPKLDMRLCDRCLQGRRRCMDSKRAATNGHRSWKRHRATRWH